MRFRSTWTSIGAVMTVIAATGSLSYAQQSGGGRVDLRADLSAANQSGDDSELTATVIYRERQQDDGLDRRFILRVQNGTPGQLYEFFLDGELTAAATADADGFALLRTRTPEYIKNADDWFPMPMTFPRIFVGQGVRVGLLFGIIRDENAPADDDGRRDIRARLFGDASLNGKVIYREREKDGDVDRRFIMRVNELQPGELVRFYLNGQFTAGATADLNGSALLRVRTPEFIEDPEDWVPMPQTFPRLFYGDALIAGSLSGFMFDEDEDLIETSQRVEVGAIFGVPGFLNGESFYSERLRKENLERNFEVVVRGGAPNGSVPVFLNGLELGLISLDMFGQGELRLRTEAYLDEDSGQIAMPDDFPSVLPSWVITVGAQNGAFFRLK